MLSATFALPDTVYVREEVFWMTKNDDTSAYQRVNTSYNITYDEQNIKLNKWLKITVI